MKRYYMLILVLALFLSGCRGEKEEKTVLFYYPRIAYSQNSEDSVIAPQTFNRGDLSSTAQLLDQYLLGPQDSMLNNPFPSGITVINVYVMGNVTLVTLSDNFAQLQGLDLALACASISRTVSGITGTPVVQIRCENEKLNGKNHITITEDSFLYLDNVAEKMESQPAEETE